MDDTDQRVLATIEKMHASGASDDDIGKFVQMARADRLSGSQQNDARAARLDAVNKENDVGSAIKEGLSQTGQSLKDRLVAMARGAGKFADIVGHPGTSTVQLAINPAARREFGRGLSDTAFGIPERIADAVGQPTYRENAQADAADPTAADYRGAGQFGGSLIPAGPMEALGKVSMGAAAPLVRQSLRPFVAAPIAAATYAAINPDNAGRRLPAALAAAGDPMTQAGPAIGAAAQGASNLLRSNPTIGRYARAKESGAYQRPDMQALPPGEEGMQRAAEQGLDRVVNRDRELARQASEAYHASVNPELDKPVDTEALRMRLLEGRQGNIDPDSGIPVRDEVNTAYNRAFDRTPEKATVRGTLMRRRGMQQDASFGSPSPTEAQTANRDVYHTFRQAVRDASPAVAGADDAYTAHARQADRRSDILFNTEENVIPNGGGSGAPDARPIDADPSTPTGAAAALEGPSDMRVSKARSAATTLGRIDDTNRPGLRAARFLEELAGQDPAFREALDFIANKKAQETTKFSLHGLRQADLHGAVGVGGLLPLIEQNARAIGARVVEPAANAASGIGPGSLRMNPLIQAMALEQERKRRMAENLRNGGR